MKGVSNANEIRLYKPYFTTLGLPLELQRADKVLTVNLSGTLSNSVTADQSIFEMNVGDVVDNTYIDNDFIGGRYSGSDTGIIVIHVGISDGVLTLTTKTAIPSGSTIAFQAVVII